LADESKSSQFERYLSLGASVVAPITIISALLFYFGYVSSRAQYAYFGIDVDAIGLSTQDYVMRSPQPLLVPQGTGSFRICPALRTAAANNPPKATNTWRAKCESPTTIRSPAEPTL